MGDAFGQATELFEVQVVDPAPAPDPLQWPFAGEEVSPDPGHTDILYALTGSDRTGTWSINGEQFPDVTIEEIALGDEAIIEVRNVSPMLHPFHIHGLCFEVLSVNGVAPRYRTVEDTFTVGIRQIVRLLVLADNPGEWMTHCHILAHAEDGMMPVLRIAE